MSDPQGAGDAEHRHRLAADPGLDQLGRLELACRTDSNTLIVTAGSPGDPATNDLRAAVLASVHAPGRTVLEIDATTHGTPRDLVTAVIDALVESPLARIAAASLPDAAWRGAASGLLHDLLTDLGHLRAASDADVYVVVTHPRPDLAHQLFGVMRDEVWEIGLTWIVITGPAAAAEFVRPPVRAEPRRRGGDRPRRRRGGHPAPHERRQNRPPHPARNHRARTSLARVWPPPKRMRAPHRRQPPPHLAPPRRSLMTTPTTSIGEDLLEALAPARWPDGSPLIKAAPEILGERLLPELLAAIEPDLKDQARA